MSPIIRRPVVKVSILALLSAITLAACSAAEPGATSSASNLNDFMQYVRTFEYDYEPAVDPERLGEEAQLVVLGSLAAVEEGQSYAPTERSDAVIATSVLRVDVEEVLAGQPGDLIRDGAVFVEVPHPAFVGNGVDEGEPTPFDHEAFATTVPLGSEALFFLDDRTSEPYWETVLNEGAGRPSGAGIAAPFVQGFLIEDDEGRLVSVNEPLRSMPPAWQGLETLEEVVSMVTGGES
jgi:hypothetical protein